MLCLQGNVVHDAGVKSVVYRFLEQYFGVFDKDDRGNFLMDAYDTNVSDGRQLFKLSHTIGRGTFSI